MNSLAQCHPRRPDVAAAPCYSYDSTMNMTGRRTHLGVWVRTGSQQSLDNREIAICACIGESRLASLYKKTKAKFINVISCFLSSFLYLTMQELSSAGATPRLLPAGNQTL